MGLLTFDHGSKHLGHCQRIESGVRENQQCAVCTHCEPDAKLLDTFHAADAGDHDVGLADFLLQPQRFLKRDGVKRVDRELHPVCFEAGAVRLNPNSRVGVGNTLEWDQNFHCIASKIPAAPMPPPMHIVTRPWRAFRRRSSSRIVTVSFAPVAPSGCPRAMAPPFTLTRSAGSRSSRITASAWAAKASFNSIRSMSSNFKPACWSA